MNSERIAELIREIWEVAQFSNGDATVPAYLIEQLALATEIIGENELEYDDEAE